jgi:hypothetical protein
MVPSDDRVIDPLTFRAALERMFSKIIRCDFPQNGTILFNSNLSIETRNLVQIKARIDVDL